MLCFLEVLDTAPLLSALHFGRLKLAWFIYSSPALSCCIYESAWKRVRDWILIGFSICLYNSLNMLCYFFHNLNCKYVFSKFLVDHGCIILHPVGEVLLVSTSLITFCCRDGLCIIGCFRAFLASLLIRCQYFCLYSLPMPVVTIRKVSKLCQMPSGGQKSPLVEKPVIHLFHSSIVRNINYFYFQYK